jgi:nucleotide-binding universal stress UspA family protein
VFETVVVGADGSAAEAVRVAIGLIKLTGGQLHILTAYKPQQLRSAASEEFSKSLSMGDPADAICEVTTQVKADVIVVGNKGMTGVRRVLGSVPNSVAHQAPCAVLIAFTTDAG